MEGSYHASTARSSTSTCMHSNEQSSHHYGGLAFAIPTWEKEFYCQAGSFKTWNHLLEAKYRSLASPAAEKVMGWDDSGAKQSFHNAKMRFFAHKFSLDVPVDPLPSPDLYIDMIEYWDEEDKRSFADDYFNSKYTMFLGPR